MYPYLVTTYTRNDTLIKELVFVITTTYITVLLPIPYDTQVSTTTIVFVNYVSSV